MKTPTYSDFRRAGYGAAVALRDAKTCAAFRKLWFADLVRISYEDEQENYFSVYGEPEGYVDGNGRRVSAEKEREELADQVERLGCVRVVTEWRPDTDSEWEHADSVGMCVYENPLDPLQNCYVPQLMQAAVDAVEAASYAPAL